VLRDIAVCSTNQGWFSLDELKCTLSELLMAAHRETGEYPN
jgi:hypothetical protein